MSLRDEDPEEFEEWVQEAVDALRKEVKVESLSPEEARDQLLGTRLWRSQGEEAREVLFAACERFRKSIDGAVCKTSNVSVLRGGSSVDWEWYEGPDPEKSVFWSPVKTQINAKLGANALNSIDDASTKVLALAGRPLVPSLRTRGLVVGHVQSGKTTNFLSVIAKAADEGYRLIIVLTGMTESLRKQTQQRMRESLTSKTDDKWFLPTNEEHDFQAESNQGLLANQEIRTLVVVKKNPHRLKRLNDWLDSAKDAAASCPILIIDDEADQASINVANDRNMREKRSRINALIGDLVKRKRTSYIAYSATPFANVLIDPNDDSDLYPKDFIVGLPTPEGYFGSEQLFGRSEIYGEEGSVEPLVDALRVIPEAEVNSVRPVGRNVDSWQPEFADSMREAVLWFVLATSARWARGQDDQHSSMLIHSSWLIEAHTEVQKIVQEGVDALRESHHNGELMEELEELWEKEVSRAPLSDSLSFQDLAGGIGKVLDKIKLHVDNGESDSRINFENNPGQVVIAIGGNTLARGITLEGLSTSYFVRTSKTYDTLLQMGRWFGFRPNYEDLVRIYMPQKLIDWYIELSTIEADFRRDIQRFEIDELTPLRAKARIRSSEAMQVTSTVKMKNHRKVNMSFSGKRVQTLVFNKEKNWLKHNIQATRRLVSTLNNEGIEPREKSGTWVFSGVSSEVILGFLSDYWFGDSPINGVAKQDLLIKYIKKESEINGITDWNISFFGQSNSPDDLGDPIDLGLPEKLNLVSRARYHTSPEGKARLQGLVGSGDRVHDLFLDAETLASLLKDIREEEQVVSEARLADIHEKHAGRGIGHLTIYAISKASKPRGWISGRDGADKPLRQGSNPAQSTAKVPMGTEEDVIGLGLFMPRSLSDKGVEYIAGIDFEDLPEDEQAEISDLASSGERLINEEELGE